MPDTEEFIWCVVANVAIAQGTKHFASGAKVYCYPPVWGDGYERVKVIGQHRGSSWLVELVMPSKQLTNWRVKAVYSPPVISKMKGWWDSSGDSKAKAEALVSSIVAVKA